jgi:hypothetical protein
MKFEQVRSLPEMAAESKNEIGLEIGHVLFIDIVGYSKLLINEQSEQIQKLKAIVRGTEQVRNAEAEGKLLRLPTGDGDALVFRDGPEPTCSLRFGSCKSTEKSSQVACSNGNPQWPS